MPNSPFRFIHAGDFHLERPLMGVSDVPDHLRELFLEAPYTAARRVFDAALTEDVQFVVLVGGIVVPSAAGPRGPLQLVESFARLAERGIGVYWAGSTLDPPESWPATIKLPQNVRFFSRGQIEEFLVQSKDGPLARVAGTSGDQRRAWRPSDFYSDPGGLYTVAVAHGEADPAVLASRGVHYWALGGRHDRSTPQSAPQVVHYCGTTQGRHPGESGVCGCTLVQVDERCGTRTSLIPTDAVRWIHERVAFDEAISRDDAEARLRERVVGLIEAMPAVALMISWTVSAAGPLAVALRRGKLAREWLDRLRGEYGYRSPPVWSMSLDVKSPETLPPEWYEQETIRGDFLRVVRRLQMNTDEPLPLESYLSESHRAGTLAAAVAPADRQERESILREAAALGVDLLTGEDSPS